MVICIATHGVTGSQIQVESQNLGLLFDDLGDFRPHAKRGEFRKQVQKMLTLNRWAVGSLLLGILVRCLVRRKLRSVLLIGKTSGIPKDLFFVEPFEQPNKLGLPSSHGSLKVARSLKVGVKRSNLKEWHELSKFRCNFCWKISTSLPEKVQETFSIQILRKKNHFLEQIQESTPFFHPFFGPHFVGACGT